jgi:beta-fructofuranosidase
MHWGHATSRDLVHWRHLPLALAPTPGGPDQDGCFSGCAVVDDAGVPTLVYTGVRGAAQRVCLARAVDPDDPDLVVWAKDPRNPVIPEPPAGLDLIAYRDPSVWREGNWWYMVHGVGLAGRGPAALLYRSRDLVSWAARPPALVGDAVHTAAGWECPQLFPLGTEHVLLVSAWEPGHARHAFWSVGRFTDERFEPRAWGQLDGGALYAPQTFVDARGRRILFGWLRENRPPAAMLQAGWSGVMSLPWLVSADPAGGLPHMAPVPELAALRVAHWRVGERGVDGVVGLELTGDSLELQAVFEPGAASSCGLVVRATPDSQELTRVGYAREANGGVIFVDRARASRDAEVDQSRVVSPLQLAPAEPLELRVFLDASVVEVFANGRATLSTRVYPTRPDAFGIALFADGGGARLGSLDAWRMAAG